MLSEAWGGQGPYPNFGWNVVLGAGARCCLKLGGGARSLSKFWMECCAGGRSKVLSEAWGGKVPIQILDGMLCWGPEQGAV